MGKSIGKPVLKLDPQAAIQGSEQAASSSAADSASNGRVIAAAKPPPQPPTSSNPDLNIDQWSDDAAPDDMDDDHWQNGNLGAQQAHYAEGESVPYRVIMSQLLEGHTYSVTILWDTTKNGKHALDYLTSWDRSFPADRDETIPDPIDGVTGLLVTTDETLAIPDNPLVLAGRDGILGNGDDIDPADGFFTFFGGVDAGSLDASAYSQLAFSSTSSDSITLTFTYIGDGDATTEIGTAVLAWGGHIASRVDWGLDSSAGAISGSPYHMALDAFAIDGVDDNVGQQDRSLSSAAVVIPAVITVVKDASVNPDDPSPPDLATTLFDFELTRLANTVDVLNGLLDLTGDGVSNGDDDGRFTDSGGEVFTVLNGVVSDLAGGDGTVNGKAIIAGVGLDTDGVGGITTADDLNNLAGTGVATFQLLDGGSKTFSLTDFGSGYVVKEVLDSAAWDLLSITTERTDINGVVTGAIINDPAGDQTSINLAEGDTWTLEFDDNQVFLANPVLDIVKTFASIEEAAGSDDTDPDPNNTVDEAGDIIHYNITVENTGNVTMTDLQVTDPFADAGSIVRGADQVGDDDSDFEVGEIWTYTAEHTVTQDEMDVGGNLDTSDPLDGEFDVLHNVATATAVFGGDEYTDTDPEDVPVLLIRALNIDKQFVDVTGGNDNGVADFVGDVINYQMLVTNTGNTALDNVQVEDPLLGGFLTGPDSGDTDLDGRLDVSETWTYTGSYTVTQADLDGEGNAGTDYDIDNTATATADDTPPDDDSEEVPLVPDPSQFILKTVVSVGGDADGVADTACEEIIYDIKVTNDGNQTLHGLVVTDTLDSTVTEVLAGGFNAGDTNTDGLMDVGETWEYTANYVVTQKDLDTNGADDPGITPPDDQLGFIDNLATATAYDPDDVAVIDTDTASVAVVQNASIDVEKYVSLDDGATWLEADTATPETETGPLDCIKFKIVVTNDGNITLNTVELTDDQLDLNYDGVDDVITLSTLSVGGSYELIYELPWELGENTNTATASALDYNGDAVGPVEDVAIYTGVV